MKLVGALDIGGSKILAGLMSRNGEIISTRRAALGDRQPQEVARQAAGLLHDMLVERRATLIGIGCSIPGPLDRRSGTIRLSPNLGWKQVPFRAMLHRIVRVPVALDDDARCAAIGEWWRGAGRGVRHLLYIVVGTGVGGGLVISGQVFHGATDSAGEIGHTLVAPGGPRCSCGKRGCLEAVASGTAIARQARATISKSRLTALARSLGHGRCGITAEQVVAAALRGDAAARRIIDRAGTYLGRAIANAVTLLNPEVVIIGGGVGRGVRRLWIPRVRRLVRQLALPVSAQHVSIGSGALGETAALVGAGWTFLYGVGATAPSASSSKHN